MKLYKCTKNIFGFEKRIRKFCCLPSDEGSGLKYRKWDGAMQKYGLPSDEGSGLKYLFLGKMMVPVWVFPRMREVD